MPRDRALNRGVKPLLQDFFSSLCLTCYLRSGGRESDQMNREGT